VNCHDLLICSAGRIPMNSSSDLLLAYYTGVRMALHAYGIQEPHIGENKAIHLLFEVANNPASEDESIHFNDAIVQRIVDGLMV
jgi:hypothetical protein